MQIDAAEQQCELFLRQLHALTRRLRPTQTAVLHVLRADPQPAAIEVQNLQSITTAIRKQKQMSTQRILLKTTGNKAIQTAKSQTHIDRSRCNINARRHAQTEDRSPLAQRGNKPAQGVFIKITRDC